LVHQHRFTGIARALSRGFLGMTLAHLGLAAGITGVTLTSLYGVERDVPLKRRESAEAGGYRFRLDDLRDVLGPNYQAIEAKVTVSRDDETIAVLRPQKRVYRVQTEAMTEAAIDPGLFRDLFVALGEPIRDDGFSLRIQYKPGVRLIWLGGLMMVLGGVLAASDRRYRLARRRARDVLPEGVATV
jgi:cytochrome c-type biogenesis protein CcmF